MYEEFDTEVLAQPESIIAWYYNTGVHKIANREDVDLVARVLLTDGQVTSLFDLLARISVQCRNSALIFFVNVASSDLSESPGLVVSLKLRIRRPWDRITPNDEVQQADA